MILPLATFEAEKKWLHALGKSQGPFFLIGFDGAEERYLLERAQDRLQQHGLKLSFQGPSQGPASFLDGQASLFGTSSWEQKAYPQLEKLSESQWQEGGPLWIVTSSKLPKDSHLALAPAAHVLSVLNEKSWQKSKRLQPWLQALAKAHGLELTVPVAGSYCEQFGNDRQMLRTEFERLAAYHGYKGNVDMPGQQAGAANVWHWLELIYKGSLVQAIAMLEDLLTQEPSGISLAAFIRSQWQGLWQSLSEEEASLDWRAKKLQQKQQLARRLGFARWKEGMLAIGHAQSGLKSSRKPLEILQVLCVRLCGLLK